jgi:methyltransferase-like protein/trans-aconitate methyltransferase
MSNPYDEILYTGRSFAQTHPDRMATLARLSGMTPAPMERCRVLELGCGDGGNLVPLAYTLPGSDFVGVDLGIRGIEAGREMARACGVRNVDLRHLDILDAGGDLGSFDYIIAHGVYSWVPERVQKRMLDLCRENLNPHGIAYISYSVYPGAHIRAMIAGMMQYRARRFEIPQQQIEQSRALLAFLASRPADDAYSLLLRSEAQSMADRTPHSLYHDELSSCQPLYFREFVERAAGNGLQYLGEADFFEMHDTSEAPEISSILRQLSRDAIEKEQYLDFLKCRRFRQTLLCHADIPLRRRINSAAVQEFYVTRAQRPGEKAPKLPTDHPAALAVMQSLDVAWPVALSFQELSAGASVSDEAMLADLVLAFFACGLVQLMTHRPRFAASAGERPRVSAVARFQAQRGIEVTNLCHRTVRFEDEDGRRLLASLDGTRDRASLAEVENLEAGLQSLAKLALLEE